jgi:hypothetical protein
MTDADYLKMLESSIKKLDELSWEREQIDMEIAKLRQWIQATVNLLPDETTEKFQARLAELEKESEIASAGLTDAIRGTLQLNYPKWLTVANVRDSLVARGFDFSSYKSNPLAAISTTLRRLAKSEENVETTEFEGVNAFRMPSAMEKMAEIVGRFIRVPNTAEHPMRKAFGRPRPSKPFYGEVDPDKLPDAVRDVVAQPKKK